MGVRGKCLGGSGGSGGWGVTSKNISKDFLYYAELGHKTKSVSPKAYSNLLGFRKNVSLINVERIKD